MVALYILRVIEFWTEIFSCRSSSSNVYHLKVFLWCGLLWVFWLFCVIGSLRQSIYLQHNSYFFQVKTSSWHAHLRLLPIYPNYILKIDLNVFSFTLTFKGYTWRVTIPLLRLFLLGWTSLSHSNFAI